MLEQHGSLLEIELFGSEELVAHSLSFRHKLLGDETRRLTRGKFSSTLQGAAPLPWTSAVKAFVRLTLQVALQRFVGESTVADPFSFGLIGEKGSACRSLDYAISKRPAWLVDLFGSDAEGNSNVGRFFYRLNPEGKRVGPTGVTFNTNMISPAAISVRLNGALVDTKDKLSHLLDGINISSSSHTTISVSELATARQPEEMSAGSGDETALKDILVSLMKRELSRTLSSTTVFSKKGVQESVHQLSDTTLFKSIAGAQAKSLGSVLECSSHSARTGITPSLEGLHSFYSTEQPLKVSVSVTTIGTIVLFHYLKVCKGLPIEVNYRFSTGIEVARAVQGAAIEPDLCAGAAPSAIALMGQGRTTPYSPVMLMPRHTHRLLASRDGGNSIAQGDYRLLTEEPSGSLSYFQELIRHKRISRNKISLAHCDPDESLHLLEQGDPALRCILWFPAYDLAQLYCGAKLLDEPSADLGDSWILLLAHERLRRNKQALSTLLAELHGAWLDLRENPELMERIVQSIVQDPEYAKVLTRSHGFHKLREARYPPLQIAV